MRGGKQQYLAGMEAGADDFITKPFHESELQARLRSGGRMLELQERLLRAQEALRLEATRDHLTGLWNRRMILDQLHRELRRAAHEHRPLAVVMVDLDHFKVVNDTRGHAAGVIPRLVKPEPDLQLAYDDPIGVTAAFNKNLFTRRRERPRDARGSIVAA